MQRDTQCSVQGNSPLHSPHNKACLPELPARLFNKCWGIDVTLPYLPAKLHSPPAQMCAPILLMPTRLKRGDTQLSLHGLPPGSLFKRLLFSKLQAFPELNQTQAHVVCCVFITTVLNGTCGDLLMCRCELEQSISPHRMNSLRRKPGHRVFIK